MIRVPLKVVHKALVVIFVYIHVASSYDTTRGHFITEISLIRFLQLGL